MPLKRLQKKLTVENLWLYILKLLSEREMYAYEIPGKIKKRFGFELGNVTTYIVLYRLKSSGYVTTEWKERRKYYRITAKGRKVLKDGRDFIRKTLDSVG